MQAMHRKQSEALFDTEDLFMSFFFSCGPTLPPPHKTLLKVEEEDKL